MVSPADFTRRGMLPKELPPTLSSASFATSLRKDVATLKLDSAWVSPVLHSLGRPGGVRRSLSVPHPLGQVRVATEIANNWNELRRHFAQSKWCRSLPFLRPRNQRAAGPRYGGDALNAEKARCRATARFLLKADISEFYRSVYTHSIPWAVRGKSVAKEAFKRKDTHWADSLDKAVRDGQQGQTNGIPCGPDTSFVIGEILLTSIDARLRARFPRIQGYRYFDDFEFGLSSEGECEDVLYALQDELAVLGLQLNSSKTEIVALPQLDDPLSFVLSLPSVWSVGPRGHDDLLQFFHRVFEYHRRHPSSQVIGLALSRLGEHPGILRSTWELAQDLMSQAVVAEPGAMQNYIRTLVTLQVGRELTVDSERLSACLDEVIRLHAARNHGSEVSWALWACMAFGLQVSSENGNLISQMDDDVVALLAMELDGRGGVQGGLDVDKWYSWMTDEQLNGEHWLVAYEGFMNKWYTGADDYLAKNATFRWLRDHGVRFTIPFRQPTKKTARRISIIRQGYDGSDEEDDILTGARPKFSRPRLPFRPSSPPLWAGAVPPSGPKFSPTSQVDGHGDDDEAEDEDELV